MNKGNGEKPVSSVCVKNISKKFNSKQVLDNICFNLCGGDIVSLVGGNGSGKSTLLNILVANDNSYDGEVEYIVDGKKLDKNTLCENIALVPQENYLIGELSAFDNLLFWYQGDKDRLNDDKNNGPISMLGVDEFIKLRVDKMSVGMQKRVALAAALAARPKFLFLDEVNAPLDILGKITIQNFLVDYVKEGNIVLMSTHDEGDIRISNRILFIKDKHIIETKASSLREIFTED